MDGFLNTLESISGIAVDDSDTFFALTSPERYAPSKAITTLALRLAGPARFGIKPPVVLPIGYAYRLQYQQSLAESGDFLERTEIPHGRIDSLPRLTPDTLGPILGAMALAGGMD